MSAAILSSPIIPLLQKRPLFSEIALAVLRMSNGNKKGRSDSRCDLADQMQKKSRKPHLATAPPGLIVEKSNHDFHVASTGQICNSFFAAWTGSIDQICKFRSYRESCS